MHRAARRVSVSRGSWPLVTACFSNRSTLARQPLSVGLPALRNRFEFRGEFALVEDHVEHRLRARIRREPRQPVDGQGAQCGERVVVPGYAGRGQHRLHRQLHALAQRAEEVGLVAEVPVHRAAREAGGGGDFLERRVRDAALAEHAQRGIQQRVARLPQLPFWCVWPWADPGLVHSDGWGFGPSCPCMTPTRGGVANIQECM